MNICDQNHLKVVSYIALALAMISIPADFPYAIYITVILGVIGSFGYAIAHYYADPTSAVTDTESVVNAVIAGVKTLKETPAATPSTPIKITPTTITEAETMLNEAMANYKALAAQTPAQITSVTPNAANANQ